MFRVLLSLAAFGLFIALGSAPTVAGEKDKEVTLKGKICCAKCELGETSKCANAIVVKMDGKDVTYYFEDKGAQEGYHAAICGASKQGSVVGTVTKMDDKMYITPKGKDAVKFD